MNFKLMKKDITVCTFFITTSEYGMSCNVIKILRKDLMPHDLRNIQEWVKSRYIILNRCGIRFFKSDRYNEIRGFCFNNKLCIS